MRQQTRLSCPVRTLYRTPNNVSMASSSHSNISLMARRKILAQRYKDKCRDQCNTSSAGWHRNDGRCCGGLREDTGQLFGRGGGPSVVMSQKNDISLTLCKIDSTARLPFFVICSVFICHKSGDANTKIPNSNTPETEHGMQSLECCDDRGRKGSGRGPSCISTTNIFSKWPRKGPS